MSPRPKPLPLPAWLEIDPPQDKRAHLSAEGWVTEFEREKVHPFIQEHQRTFARIMWPRIVERAADGRFKIEANDDFFERVRPGCSPFQRQEAAFLGMIEEAVFHASRGFRITNQRPYGPNWPVNTIGLPRIKWMEPGGASFKGNRAKSKIAADPRKEFSRGVCVCLLIASKLYWNRVRPRIAWRLTMLVMQHVKRNAIIECESGQEVKASKPPQFSFESVKALVEMLGDLDEGNT
jgi:hypothetical protein